MEHRLHQLESFRMDGSDGTTYTVRGYEHLVRDDSANNSLDNWESTGQAEYRLDDGTRVEMAADGAMRVPGSGVMLRRQ